MAARVFLLVQWLDDSYILPSYGVVDVDNLSFCEADLEPESLICIRISQENARQAKIIQISGMFTLLCLLFLFIHNHTKFPTFMNIVTLLFADSSNFV